jgi:hypothetical protein
MGNLGRGIKLGSGSTNIMPGRGLINPAFVIKIVKVTDDIQEPKSNPRNNPNDDYFSNLNIGDDVDAKVDGKTVSGSVRRVIKNSLGDAIKVVVMDKRGKKHEIVASSIRRRKKFNKSAEDAQQAVLSPAVYNESIMTFEEFSND